MKFAYRAYDTSGSRLTGETEASSVQDATDQLRRKGLFVSDVAQAADRAAVSRRTRRRTRTGLRSTAAFYRQLAVLVSTGTPVVEALRALERQTRDARFRSVIVDVREQVEGGSSLAESMERHAVYFDAICRSLIAAGESGGRLSTMLDRLAGVTRQQLHVRNQILGAMVYPALLLTVAGTVLVLMLLFVLPRFSGLFESLDVPLPPTTQAMLWISEHLRAYWWMALIFCVVCACVGWRWASSSHGRSTFDTALVRFPVVARMTRSMITAELTRVLGVLLHSKVPMLEAIDLARQAVTNVQYVALIERAREAVTKGEPISSAFSDERLIEPSVQEALRNGEQAGQLAAVLLQIADFLDEDNDVVIKSATSILEPVILLILGVLVGFVAVSMFLPLFDLTSMAAPGG